MKFPYHDLIKMDKTKIDKIKLKINSDNTNDKSNYYLKKKNEFKYY